jgi:hypothetical protein
MKWMYGIAAASVVAVVGITALTGCEGDESAPTRPRMQGVLTPDEKAKDNAFNRETETPKQTLPTSGAEFPGQSRATPVSPNPDEPTVITAAAAGGGGGIGGAGGGAGATGGNLSGGAAGASGVPSAGSAANPNGNGNLNVLPYGTFQSPESSYNTGGNYTVPGGLPALSVNPGTTPAVGSTAVPNIGLTLDHSWGEVLPLENYPHRAWPDTQTTYVPGTTKHNPVYYYNIQDHLPITNNGGWVGNWTSNALEVPWFYINTLALPVLMVLEPPFEQRTTERLGNDPLYFGYLPKGGAIIPSPTPGTIKWEYPFLKAAEENATSDQISTQPATTQTQDIPPVAPTLDTPASTAPLSH